jgi:AraC-like DNA-binding protein
MPIFMDRHDVSETVTAENVAHLHQEDLKIQGQFGCRGLTYWFDNKRKTAFCLIEADDKNDIIEMHGKAHGEVPNQIIEVDANIVESFLGRIEDPKKAKGAQLNIIDDSAFRTIMVVTLEPQIHKGYDFAKVRSYSEQARTAILEILASHDGKLVKQREKGFLISFTSASKGVSAALKIKSYLTESDDDTRKHFDLSIGLSAGVPVTEKKSIFEDVIISAERMCRAIKREIIITSDIKELYDQENPEPSMDFAGVTCLSREDEAFLKFLMNFTEANWNNAAIKVEDLNKAMGYSKSQLYRKMIELTGVSPNTFISHYRLEEALVLLTKNSRNIAEIAYQTGFTSPSYFSKCFQKRYNHLPSEFQSAKTT